MVELLQKILRRRAGLSPRRRRLTPSCAWVPALVERLERRTMLAGNVLAELVGGDLILTGDGADNSFAVSAVAGDVRIQGLEGTTINGSADPFVGIAGGTSVPRNLVIRGGDGNDKILVGAGVAVGGEVLVEAGDGNDTINLNGLAVQGRIVIRGGAGDDGVSLIDTGAGGDIRIDGETGGLVVGVDHGLIEEDLVVRNSGTTSVVLDTANIRGSADLKAGGGNVSVVVMDSFFGDRLGIHTGSGDDFVFVDPTRVTNASHVKTSTGDDSVVFQGANDLGGNTTVDGGDGTDARTFDAANVVVGPPGLGGFEFDPVPAATIALRMNDPVVGALPALARVNDVAAQLLAPPLTIDISSNGAIASNDTVITDDPLFQIAGTTQAGAIVEVDRDGDGFDDGMAVALADGTFVIDVNLLIGANDLRIRSTSAGTGGRAIVEQNVHRAEGTVVRFDSSLGSFDVELLNDDAPITVANFLNYLGRYANSIVHRSIGPPNRFVIQGGGFTVNAPGTDPTQVTAVTTDPAIVNEFNAANPNIRGTLSTALVGGNFDSATSQWFVNTVDNTHLNAARHTVFGRVIGSGMEVVDDINELPTVNLNGVFPQTALATTPLEGFTPFTQNITGTVTVADGATVVNGTGTLFTQELTGSVSSGGQIAVPGSSIQIGGQEFLVDQILTDELLTLDTTHTGGATAATAQIHEVPDETLFVVFSDISRILL
ncbi:MAG: peptidylprolyl isomerase [Planctomycetes bacterium]|nr:peptidylprolyl isomerase [Planctomycetota bacterium]